jgi:poly(hydroxyalkanoate) granule-associated protein
MVTKLKKKAAASSKTTPDLSNSIKDSAQQIWQAGLGAFNKAQAGGTKAFEALVKEGVSLQRKTQSAAEEKISEATQKMTNMATDISSKASGQWDKLENIFEDRVAKALNKLGVPSAKDVDALIARIDALNASVQKLSPAKAAAKPAAKTEAKAAAKPTVQTAKKAVAKPVAKTKAKAPSEAVEPAVKAPAKAATKPAPRKAAARKASATTEAKPEAAADQASAV